MKVAVSKANLEKISAITITVREMRASVRFYKNILGLELLHGGQNASFSSFRTNDDRDTILNLEQGIPVTGWGRIIFYVSDVDTFWAHMKEEGFNPDRPRDAQWGERYFHMHDPDGHELSLAQRLK